MCAWRAKIRNRSHDKNVDKKIGELWATERQFDQYLLALLWVMYCTVGVSTVVDTNSAGETGLTILGLGFGLMMCVRACAHAHVHVWMRVHV